MKIYFATQAEAQTAADAAHQYLIDSDRGYSTSVAEGKTVAWGIPIEEDDRWFIWIDPRLYELFGVEVEQM